MKKVVIGGERERVRIKEKEHERRGGKSEKRHGEGQRIQNRKRGGKKSNIEKLLEIGRELKKMRKPSTLICYRQIHIYPTCDNVNRYFSLLIIFANATQHRYTKYFFFTFNFNPLTFSTFFSCIAMWKHLNSD